MEINSKDFSPRGLWGVMGWVGTSLPKTGYHGLGQAVRHTLHHRLCLHTSDVTKGY